MDEKTFEEGTEKTTEIVFIMDESGSMNSKREEAVKGFNEFISEQKEVPGEANLTLISFDDIVRTILTRKPIEEVNTITDDDFTPSGCTALYDAMGNAFSQLDEVNDEDSNIVMVVMTDGKENTSSDFTADEIKEKVKEKKKHDWDILFLSCDIDSFNDAKNIGVDIESTMQYTDSGEGYSKAMRNMSQAVSRSRLGQDATDDDGWGNVNED